MGIITCIKLNGMFSVAHICYIVLFLILGLTILLCFSKLIQNNLKLFNFVIAIIVTSFEIVKIGYTHYLDHVINNLDKSNIYRWVPLSFCSLFIYALWASLSKIDFVNKCGYIFLATGALFAGLSFLIYPSTAIGDFPWNNFYSILGMFYHFIMFFTGLCNLIYGEIKPTLKNFIYYLVFTTFFIVPVLIIYYLSGISFMFVGEPNNLPDVINEVYKYNSFLYTSCVVLGHYLIYLIVLLIYQMIAKISAKKLQAN